MNSAIIPVTIFPGIASRLRVADSWVSSLNSPPRFHYYLETAGGEILKEDDCEMTEGQWDDWSNVVPDADYILGAVAFNLGLTLTA